MKSKADIFSSLLVFACAAILLGALVFSLTGNPFLKPHLRFTADFADVAGIRLHSPLYYAGDKIGIVHEIEHLAPGDRLEAGATVRLHLAVKKPIPIPKNVEISITSESMLGEMFVSLKRIDDDGGELQDGDQLIATETNMLETLVPGADKIVKDVTVLIENLRDFTDKLEEGKGAVNLTETLDNANTLTAALKDILTGEKGEMRGKIKTMITNLTQVSEDVKTLVSGSGSETAGGDPALATRIQTVLGNLESFTTRLNEMLVGAEGANDGLQHRLDKITEEIQLLLAGNGGDQEGLRRRLDEITRKIDGLLFDVQTFVVWGEYVTGTLAEKPNRLIMGSERNEVPTKEQILRFLEANPGASYPVVIKGNNPAGAAEPGGTSAPPSLPAEDAGVGTGTDSGTDSDANSEEKKGFLHNLFRRSDPETHGFRRR